MFRLFGQFRVCGIRAFGFQGSGRRKRSICWVETTRRRVIRRLTVLTMLSPLILHARRSIEVPFKYARILTETHPLPFLA